MIKLFGPGDTILFPRRQLSTVIQYPKDGHAYKCNLSHFSYAFKKEFGYAPKEIVERGEIVK